MTDLRKAAEMAVEMFDWLERRSMYQDLQMKETHEALRHALEQPEQEPWVHDLKDSIEKGTKAWADVPNATEWVDDLRGNDTPEVIPDVDNAYTKNDTKAGVLHKEWVGLSEDEFEKILETHNEAMPFTIYLNIEQALKEKNR